MARFYRGAFLLGMLAGLASGGCREKPIPSAGAAASATSPPAPSVAASQLSTTCAPGVTAPIATEPGKSAHDANDFSFALYCAAACGEGNVAVSGFVTRNALGVLAAASAGVLPTDLWRGLGYGPSPTAGRDEMAGWTAAAQGSKLTTGTRVFYEGSLPLDALFRQRAEQTFGHDFETVAFRKEPRAAAERMGKWLSQATAGQLQPAIGPEDLVGTDLVIGTAFGLSADWRQVFAAGATQDAPFTRRDGTIARVPMMFTVAAAAYAKLADVELLDLPLADDKLGVLFVLPARERDLATLEATLGRKTYDAWRDSLHGNFVSTRLPRFEVDRKIDLTRSIERLSGVDRPALRVFADHSGAEVRLVHEAKVTVDESGIRASASSFSVSSIAAEGTPPPDNFVADRPFLFIVHDRSSEGSPVLVVGRVDDPNQK